MIKVVILQHRLLHYRVAFFELLREKCIKLGIELNVVHGQASKRESVKKDEGGLPWALKVENRFWEFGARDLVWQPFPLEMRDADLVVVMQENRILSNYPLLLKRYFNGPKVAYWGHGVNFQSDAPSGLRERWKQFLLTKVDWWFAYTEMTVDLLLSAQYPMDKITRLDNAIDTNGFKDDLASFSEARVVEEKKKLGYASSAPVGLFCGSLYPDKKLDLLVGAADYIRQRVPGFGLVVIGDGPSMPLLQEAAESRPWLQLLGVQKGFPKALYFRMADVMLNPGLVGLHIVDAFCASLILCTTDNARHSPEVAYLKNGINGLMISDSVEAYGQAIVELFADPDRLARMKNASLADSNHYTMENMAENFANGIKSCLES
ncbi:glycosyltransferase family 4 protein [Desulfobacterota bacterium M19]